MIPMTMTLTKNRKIKGRLVEENRLGAGGEPMVIWGDKGCCGWLALTGDGWDEAMGDMVNSILTMMENVARKLHFKCIHWTWDLIRKRREVLLPGTKFKCEQCFALLVGHNVSRVRGQDWRQALPFMLEKLNLKNLFRIEDTKDGWLAGWLDAWLAAPLATDCSIAWSVFAIIGWAAAGLTIKANTGIMAWLQCKSRVYERQRTHFTTAGLRCRTLHEISSWMVGCSNAFWGDWWWWWRGWGRCMMTLTMKCFGHRHHHRHHHGKVQHYGVLWVKQQQHVVAVRSILLFLAYCNRDCSFVFFSCI